MIVSLIIFDSSGGTFSPFPFYIDSFALKRLGQLAKLGQVMSQLFSAWRRAAQ
jgi:hypothetical protein